MIFVTVGTQLPFDRMVRTVDEWAGLHAKGREVFAQIGPSQFKPRHIQSAPFIPADECRRRTCSARVIIAHAGMGSIITALELGKPILVMPRRASMGEQRNDHQVATAHHFLEQGRVAVAFDEEELMRQLEQIEQLAAGQRIDHVASPRLLRALRSFAGRLDPAKARDQRDARAFEHNDFVPQPVFDASPDASPAVMVTPGGS
jgi:UDP-N-acetylglucosamine transferase subunit ALG13